jgi:hypothetical protein
MTCLSNFLSLEDMRIRGCSFQFFSAKKDYVSKSFAILRGVTHRSVGTIMDEVLAASHSVSAHFKLLGHHGEHQVKRDDGNLKGVLAKGAELILGAVITATKERTNMAWVPLQELTVGSNASTKSLEMWKLIRTGKSSVIILEPKWTLSN